ncbi:MAG: hypothetical protein HC942_02300 [Microcoleus sp. SU_5_6]|nr:hypothetical protein [Microcoleus sp. SU_5_6]
MLTCLDKTCNIQAWQSPADCPDKLCDIPKPVRQRGEIASRKRHLQIGLPDCFY